LVTLPSGESIDPQGIDGIEITDDGGLFNVCIVRRNSSRSVYYTSFRWKAKRFAKAAAKAINAANARNTSIGQD
jgi:hypothetical protein